MNMKKWLLSAACALPFLGNAWAVNGDEVACMRLVRQADSCFFAGDFRRAEVGLPSLDAYLEMMNVLKEP